LQVEYRCLFDAYNEEKLNEFKEATVILDQNRNQVLKDINPRLYDIVFK
jgi:hypothetical protein